MVGVTIIIAVEFLGGAPAPTAPMVLTPVHCNLFHCANPISTNTNKT